MPDQQPKIYSKDYIDGVLQGLKTLETYVSDGGLTSANIETERQYYLSLPVAAPTKESLELIEIKRNQKEMEDFYNSLDVIPLAVANVKEALKSIGLEAVPVKTSISLTNQ